MCTINCLKKCQCLAYNLHDLHRNLHHFVKNLDWICNMCNSFPGCLLILSIDRLLQGAFYYKGNYLGFLTVTGEQMLKCMETYYHLNGYDAGSHLLSLSLLCWWFKNQFVIIFFRTLIKKSIFDNLMVACIQAYEKGLMIAVIPFTSKVWDYDQL